MTSEPVSEITEETIRLLVDRFYQKVRADADLGPVFENAIGTSEEAWGPHLRQMYDFWSSVMCATGRYYGSPMQKHIALPAFDPALFERWLVLFEETAQEIHTEETAARYLATAHRIAANLKRGIFGIQEG